MLIYIFFVISIQGVCTEAGMYALRERRVHVTQEDFELAVAKVSYLYYVYINYHPSIIYRQYITTLLAGEGEGDLDGPLLLTTRLNTTNVASCLIPTEEFLDQPKDSSFTIRYVINVQDSSPNMLGKHDIAV
jgi:hypothetical protein